jgi:heat shock protein HspQ
MTEIPEISLKAAQTGSLEGVALDDAASYQLLGVIRDGIQGGRHLGQLEQVYDGGAGIGSAEEQKASRNTWGSLSLTGGASVPLSTRTTFCTLPIGSLDLTDVRLSSDAADSLYKILRQRTSCLSRLVLNRFYPTPANDRRAIRTFVHLLRDPQSPLQTLEVGNEQAQSTDLQQRLVFELTQAVVDCETLHFFNGIPLLPLRSKHGRKPEELEKIRQSTTSNVAKYKLGQHIETPFSGVIVGIKPNKAGATSGPGVLDIRKDRAAVKRDDWRVQVAKTGSMGLSVFCALLKGYEQGHGDGKSVNGQTLEGKTEATVDSLHPVLKVFFQWQLTTVAAVMLQELNGLSIRNVSESGQLNLHGRVLEPYEQVFIANLVRRATEREGQCQITSITFHSELVVFTDAFRSSQGRGAFSTSFYEYNAGQDSDTAEKTKQSSTSNVANYQIGQHVETPFRGVVVSITPKNVGAKSGPGVIDIRTQIIRDECDDDGENDASEQMKRSSTSNVAKYKVGQSVEKPFKGLIVGITANEAGAMSGPGVLDINVGVTKRRGEAPLWSGSSVRDVDCCLISNLLSAQYQHGSLHALDLSRNAITDQGAFWLAACLKINTPLRTLLLNKNAIRDSGLAELASALEVNQILRRFDVSGNNVSRI